MSGACRGKLIDIHRLFKPVAAFDSPSVLFHVCFLVLPLRG